MRRFLSIFVIAGMLFGTPYSFRIGELVSHADSSATSSSSVPIGSDTSETGISTDANAPAASPLVFSATGTDESGSSAASSDTSSGNSGTTTESDGTGTVISSGNASTSAEADNSINNNNVEFGGATDTADTASTSISSSTSTSATSASSSAPDATVKNGSTADASSSIDMAAATGDNSASSTGDVLVSTGNAIANASLLNVVNTNLVNSYGELLSLSNLLRGSVNQVDLRMLGFFADPNSGMCAVCNGAGLNNLTVQNDSTATLDNSLSAHATSGGNAASSLGTATVSSGNAYAAGNLINLAGDNFVNSDYLFLTYNNFGDWNGDIVFPNATDFLKALNSSASTSLGELALSNADGANATDSISAEASSGDNSFTSLGGSSSGSVSSGSSSAVTNILNLLNSDLAGGASMNLLFNVYGSWSGTVFGLPPGVEWSPTATGFELSYDSYQDLAGDLSGASASTTHISNTASTTIGNAIDVSASSGGNAVSGSGGGVSSGNAYAAANVINVANTNMIGHNMFWAIINIFGNWSGDVSFGKPDLWIGGHADMTGSSVDPGEDVTYHFTVINNGDLPATGVTVHTDLGSKYLEDTASGTDEVVTELGTIDPKTSKTFDIVAQADPSMPEAKEMITTTADVSSVEPDNNMADNHEDISVVLGEEHTDGSDPRWRVFPDTDATSTTVSDAAMAEQLSKNLLITERHDGPKDIHASSTVNYTVDISNDNDVPIYNTKYRYRITDTEGKSVHGEVWDIGELDPHEELELSYSVFFKGGSPAGIYTDAGYVTATVASSTDSAPIVSNTALDSVAVLVEPVQSQRSSSTNLKLDTSKEDGTATATLATTSSSTAALVSDNSDPALSQNIPGVPVYNGGKNFLAAALFALPQAATEAGIAVLAVLLIAGILAIRRRRYA